MQTFANVRNAYLKGDSIATGVEALLEATVKALCNTRMLRHIHVLPEAENELSECHQMTKHLFLHDVDDLLLSDSKPRTHQGDPGREP